MITVKEYLEAINYRITGGSEFQWQCFGSNARYLDCDDGDFRDCKFSINAVFDTVTQEIYTIETWDYLADRAYRWISPDYRKAYKKACKKKGVDFEEASDEMKFIDLDVKADILEKTRAIAAGESYDSRVQMEIDIPDEDLLQYMIMAHKRDVTFNEFVEEALRFAIEEHQRDPEGAKARAQEFINTHPRSVEEDIDEE